MAPVCLVSTLEDYGTKEFFNPEEPPFDISSPEMRSQRNVEVLSDGKKLSVGNVTRVSVRIARAKTGESEIRLLSERIDGNHTKYLLEKTKIWPYQPQITEMESRKKESISEAKANMVFEAAIAENYPTIILPNGKLVSVHLDLM